MTKEKKPDKGRKAHPKKKNFSSFNTKEAYQQLNIKMLLPWDHAVKPASPSDFFQERMARLQRHFDLKTCEDSKKLLIDAVCEEALEGFDQIKIWKGASLETTTTTGVAGMCSVGTWSDRAMSSSRTTKANKLVIGSLTEN
jgi:hypothetical protein